MALQRRIVLLAEKALAETLGGGAVQSAKRPQRATKTEVWLTVQPSTVNGTELGAQKWRDALFLRYGLEPPVIPHYCDGCNNTFSICHALDCKWVVLVMARHNEIRDKVADLAGKSFFPSQVRNIPLIFAGCAVKRPKENSASTKGTTVLDNMPPLEATEQKGDLLIRDLWHIGTESVHDMRIVNTDAKSHLAKTSGTCLREAEQAKKNMYLEACLQQSLQSSSFVASVDRLLGVEATATLKRMPVDLQQSRGNPNRGRADTSRVESPSLWYGPHTGVSGVPGCWRTKLVSSARSGKTAPGSTSSGKRAKIS